MSLVDGVRVRARLFVEYCQYGRIPERIVVSLSPADSLCVGTTNCYIYVDLHSSFSVVYRSELQEGLPNRWYGPGRAGKFVRSGLAELERQMPDLLVTEDREAPSAQPWMYLDYRVNLIAALGVYSAPPVRDGADVPHWPLQQDQPDPHDGSPIPERRWVSIDSIATHSFSDAIDIEMVCPLLSEYVASMLAARSAMLKERRQARGKPYFGLDGLSNRRRNKDKNKNKERKGKGEGKGQEG